MDVGDDEGVSLGLVAATRFLLALGLLTVLFGSGGLSDTPLFLFSMVPIRLGALGGLRAEDLNLLAQTCKLVLIVVHERKRGGGG